ncbi:MAG: hypothetical protein CM1200mP10_04820 [Candidatus Neomarinimicrobiota bacterium]|nr:MAG: hypothetical protein CM1200mP10_04820 [Candidatus Neomarinimicrobiota bacterium]
MTLFAQNPRKGRSAIILLPEIALTPQIAGRFRAVFGETVGAVAFEANPCYPRLDMEEDLCRRIQGCDRRS